MYWGLAHEPFVSGRRLEHLVRDQFVHCDAQIRNARRAGRKRRVQVREQAQGPIHVDRSRHMAARARIQERCVVVVQRAQNAGQAIEMITVQVRDEELVGERHADRALHELAQASFGAIEHPIGLRQTQTHTSRVPTHGRRAGAGTEEHELEARERQLLGLAASRDERVAAADGHAHELHLALRDAADHLLAA